MLSEAKAKMLMQACRLGFVETSIRELYRRIQSNRMEIDHTNIGQEQSRRDQARLHEELAERERALRETHITHIRSIHDMEELKRAQEMRIDKFSRRRLMESQDTINELTSPNTGIARSGEIYE